MHPQYFQIVRALKGNLVGSKLRQLKFIIYRAMHILCPFKKMLNTGSIS